MATFAHLTASSSHFQTSPQSSFSADWMVAQETEDDVASLAQTIAPAPKRPRLSLNTACPRSLGRSTGLRLDTMTVMSPTVRNTYSNSLEDARSTTYNASGLGNMASSRPLQCNSMTVMPPSCPPALQPMTEIDTSSCEASTSTQVPPYIQPANLRSILKNHPGLSSTLRRNLPNQSPTPLSLTVRKHVSFSHALVEEITTTTYTAQHSDLLSNSPSPTLLPQDTSSTTRKHPHEDDDNHPPQTPAAGPRKKQMNWEWTLGHLPGLPSTLIDPTLSLFTTSSNPPLESTSHVLENQVDVQRSRVPPPASDVPDAEQLQSPGAPLQIRNDDAA